MSFSTYTYTIHVNVCKRDEYILFPSRKNGISSDYNHAQPWQRNALIQTYLILGEKVKEFVFALAWFISTAQHQQRIIRTSGTWYVHSMRTLAPNILLYMYPHVRVSQRNWSGSGKIWDGKTCSATRNYSTWIYLSSSLRRCLEPPSFCECMVRLVRLCVYQI